METEQVLFNAAFRRIHRGMIGLGVLGAAAGLIFRGPLWALAFTLGAAAAWLNFSWLHQAVEMMGPDARPTRKRLLWFLGLRYLLFGAAGYVIVKVFGMNVIAAFAGLFVPVAAVVVEILYELIHGT